MAPSRHRFTRSRLAAASLILGLLASGCAGSAPAQAPSAVPKTTEATQTQTQAPSNPAPSTSTSAPPEPEQVDCKKVKCIALTYDDGPGPLTPKLLKTLVANDAKATFFLLGYNMRAYPKIVKLIANTPGMELGNHSTTHPKLNFMSNSAIRKELQQNIDTIKKLTGRKPTVFRPPYGMHNSRVDAIAKKLGMPVISWSLGSEDWVHHNRRKTIDTVVSQARPGAVVLMHDIHPSTVKAAPELIRKLKAKGYHLVTVSQMLPSMKPGRTYA